MPQVATEPIEAPADNTLEQMAAHIGDEPVEGGAAVLRAGYGVVDVLDGCPAAGRDEANGATQQRDGRRGQPCQCGGVS